MLCDNCKKNEATKTFIATWMGRQHEIHICQECLEQMWQYAGAAGQREAFTAFAGWWPGKEEPRKPGSAPFPPEADMRLKMKRQMAALKARLEEAVQKENYEEAARLRDRILETETDQEVSSHEC